MTQPFSGFSQQGLNFLQQVRIENDKAWFDGNRDIYDRELLAPFRALVEQLAPGMLAIDPLFETRPAIGKRCRAFIAIRVFHMTNRATAAACG